MALAAGTLLACSSGDDEATSSTTSTTSRSASTTTTEAPTFTGDEGSPFCQQLRGIDPSTLLAGDPSDPTVVEAGFTRLVGVLRDIHALAPPEIEADAKLVADGIAALDAALATVAYDFDALAASSASAEVTAAVNDPAFTAAGDRLSAYRQQVCHL